METSLALTVRRCDTGVALCSVTCSMTLGVMGKTGGIEYPKEKFTYHWVWLLSQKGLIPAKSGPI